MALLSRIFKLALFSGKVIINAFHGSGKWVGFNPARLATAAGAFLCLSASAQVPFAFWKGPASGSTAPVPGYQYLWSGDAGVAISGGTVASWTDQVGGVAVTPYALATGPGTATQNGYTVLTFSDSGFGNGLINSGLSFSAPWEIVAVVETGSDILNGNPYPIAVDGTARGALVSASQWELSWNLTTYGGSPAASTWYIVDTIFSASGTSSMLINGASTVTQSGSAISTSGGLEFGAFGTVDLWSGSIAMIVIYTTPLSSGQQAQNVTNLRLKYGF